MHRCIDTHAYMHTLLHTDILTLTYMHEYIIRIHTYMHTLTYIDIYVHMVTSIDMH